MIEEQEFPLHVLRLVEVRFSVRQLTLFQLSLQKSLRSEQSSSLEIERFRQLLLRMYKEQVQDLYRLNRGSWDHVVEHMQAQHWAGPRIIQVKKKHEW